MGAVFRPKDFGRNYKKLIDNSLKDLSPDIKDDVYELFNTWEGTTSEEKLIKMIGSERMEKLSKEIRKNLGTLNEDEKEDVKNIFKDSLTFD
jgi:gas vesicle protein